jgi:Fic-DOC domain mobile mystery protein B
MSDVFHEPEGATPLDPDETEGLRFSHVQTRDQLNELEQHNIQSGLQWLAKQKKPDVLSEEFARELHKRLFGEVWLWAGTFRKTEKSIGIDPIYIGVELKKLLDDTKYWIENDTFSPIELAARFHHRLVYIHLFPNGNGRHARIMADAILTKLCNQPSIDWAGGYALEGMNERRKQYISALRKADGHNFDELLKFVGL